MGERNVILLHWFITLKSHLWNNCKSDPTRTHISGFLCPAVVMCFLDVKFHQSGLTSTPLFCYEVSVDGSELSGVILCQQCQLACNSQYPYH